MNKKLKLEKKNNPRRLIKFVKDRKAHDLRYQVNFNKIKKLKWNPKINIKKGLEDTINWYIKKNNE